jgi:hypothetical protein
MPVLWLLTVSMSRPPSELKTRGTRQIAAGRAPCRKGGVCFARVGADAEILVALAGQRG